MRTLFLSIIFFGILTAFKSQSLIIKINNKTGYDVHEISIPNNQLRSIEADRTIIINDLKSIIVKNDLSYSPLSLGVGTIYNKQASTICDWTFHYATNYDTLSNCDLEYDLLISEYSHGYKLYYKFVNINHKPKKGIVTNKYRGEYFPLNKEGDLLPAICREGILKINEGNTFAYILTPDKTWCPDMKEYIYEGSCEEKNDTLYLYNKEFKTPLEPHFSILDVDTGNTVLISLFNEAGEAVTIEDAHSINSAQKTANTNKIKIPFKRNIIEIKDKRIFGITIYPIGYPEVQIVLKKIRASAKINIILSATYYESVFNGRKFILEKNILSEVGGTGISTNRYIKN